MTTVGSYALVAQRHMQRYGTTSEQLAEIAVTMRRHASLNPAAKMRTPITVDDVLASRMISRPAAPARLLHHQRRRRRAWSSPRRRGRATCRSGRCCCSAAARPCAHQEIGAPDLLTIGGPPVRRAGVRHGRACTHDDIDLCMIYDSFTITVLATLENLGFCKPGEGGGVRDRAAASGSAASCR